MQIQRGRSGPALLSVSLIVLISGCVTAHDVPLARPTDEGRYAAQLMHEREQEVAALRAEVASTRIAAAKQEADLHELRATVVQLRQENGEAHQALLEAKRALNVRETEVATVKTERDQLAQTSVHLGTTERQLTVLHDTVASLSQELAAIKSTMALGKPTPADSVARQDRDERIIPAVHIFREDAEQSKPSWITVQPGDSWWSVARTHRTTVKALRAINGRVGDHLNVGEAIRLP